MLGQLNKSSVKLVRFILRRDRVRIPIWILAISLITIVVAPAFNEMFPTQQERLLMAQTMNNPAMIAMVGPGYGLDNYTVGAMMAHEMLLFTALAVAIMSIFLVVRHTRGDEERGRLELIRSLPVGRLSNLSATVTVSVVVNIILSLIIGFGLYALGIESMGLNGSLLYGAALGSVGILFTAVTAVFSQLSQSSRGAIGYSFAFLGICYLVRAVGDVGNEILSLISPLGLVLRSEVYVNNIWWPVFVVLGEAVAIILVAYYLNFKRDLQAGLIQPRPGRKDASPFLRSPFSLALRLMRSAIIAWSVGMLVLGMSYGSVLGDLEAFFESNELIKSMLPSSGQGFTLTEQFLTLLMSIISIFGTVPALQILLKLKGEEKRDRCEPLLAGAVSRTRLLAGFLVISIAVSIIMQFLTVLGLWAAGSIVMEQPISFSRMISAAFVYMPAMWTMIGLTVLLIGFYPKATGFVWLYLIFAFFVVYLGRALQLPEWTAELTPFGHIPQIPVDDMNFVTVSVLTVIAAVLSVFGFAGYNRRDIG